jgi:excisionase family DNA binding protein
LPAEPSALFLTARQASLRLGVSDKMVYKLFHAGKLKGLKIEGAVRIEAASVDAYIAAHSNTQPAPAEPATTKGRRRRDDGFTSYYLGIMSQIEKKQRRRVGG